MPIFNDIVSSIPSRFRREKAVDYETVFHFDIDEGGENSFTVIISNGNCEVKKGLTGLPNCIIRTKTENYVSIELGKLNPQLALLTGKIKVSNLAEMMRFAKMFRQYSPGTLTDVLPSHISSRKPQSGPLKNIRILDMTRLLPGPMATMLLADMGAEVIKIEDPAAPDYIRNFAPFIGETAAHYLSVNRSKRSLALDHQSEEGKKILLQLAKTADIFIEQFRPGVMEKLGLGYEQIKAVNPGIIYVSITGYGQTGPYAQQAGHDINYIGYAGLLGVTGNMETGPTIPGGQIADIAGGGYMAVNACLAALWARQATGEGQHVDVSMTDCMVPLVSIALADHSATGNVAQSGRMPLSGGNANYNVYACADGKYIALGALEPKFWDAFCDMAHRQEWKQRILDERGRMQELKDLVAALFRSKTQSEWIEMAAGKDVCLSPVLEINELAQNEHMKQRAMILQQETPEGLVYQTSGIPLKFSGTPAQVAWTPPRLGEDTIAILKELGYNELQIADLLRGQIALA